MAYIDKYGVEFSDNQIQLIRCPKDFEGSYTIPQSVTNISTSAFEGCSSLTSITIPNSVKSISGRAFYGCSALTSIVIPDSVTSIDYFAFGYCSSLTSIIIPNSVTSIGYCAFANCSSLTFLHLSSGLTSIEKWAFSKCSSLTAITIPDTVKEIGNGAFADCPSIISITVDVGNPIYDSRNGCNAIIDTVRNILICGCQNTIIPNNIALIGDSAFDGCSNLSYITIPNGIEDIRYCAFRGCTSLKTITIPRSVRFLFAGAFEDCSSLVSIIISHSEIYFDRALFSGCSSLASIVIPNNQNHIGAGMFSDCSSLTSVTISENINTIEEGAFKNCSSLTSIIIPNGVTRIEQKIFEGCSSLASIIVKKGNRRYDSRDNCNAVIETASNTLVCGCKNTIIPDSVTNIEAYAFAGCNSLKSIVIPDNVREINEWTFSDCNSLISVTIPESVKSIKFCAFHGCNSLNSIILPNRVTNIKHCVFSGCSSLMSITLPKNLTTIGERIFEHCESLQIIRVPRGKKEEYCKLGLEPYRDLIQEPQEEEYTILLNIAKGYELGIGMAKNLPQAVLLYNQAADKGCAEAAYHLGELYEKGEGLPLDYQQAIVWYTKAVALYHPLAEQRKKHCEKVVHEEEQRLHEQNKIQYQNTSPSSPQIAKYLFFDTETTGLPPKILEGCPYNQIDIWPRLVQIGWIVTDENGNTIKRRSEIIRPEGFIIPKGASDVHGITTEKAMQIGVPIGKVLREIYDDMLNVKLLVAHNFNFDSKILGAEFYRKNIDTNIIDDKEHICTMLSTTDYCELLSVRFGEYKWPKLEELHHKLFGCTFSGAHDALADVEATKKCFFELKKKGIL